MANKPHSETFRIDVEVGNLEKYKSQLDSLEKTTKGAVSAIEKDNKIHLSIDPNVAGAKEIAQQLKNTIGEIELKFATNKESLQKLSDDAKKERDKIAHMWNDKGFKVSLIPEETKDRHVKIKQNVQDIVDEYGKLDKQVTTYRDSVKKAADAEKTLKDAGVKKNETNINELKEEARYLDLRQAALQRIAELEQKTYTNKKGEQVEAYKESADTLREYSKMLELVQTVENRMRSGKGAAKVSNTPILDEFKNFDPSDSIKKMEALKDAVTEVYLAKTKIVDENTQKLRNPNLGIYGEEELKDLLSVLGKVFPEFEKLRLEAEKAGQAEVEAGEEGKEAAENTAEAVAKAEEAYDKAKGKVDEYKASIEEASKAADAFRQKANAYAESIAKTGTMSGFNKGIDALSKESGKPAKGQTYDDIVANLPTNNFIAQAKGLADALKNIGSKAGLGSLNSALSTINGTITNMEKALERVKLSANTAVSDETRNAAIDKIQNALDIIKQYRDGIEASREEWTAVDKAIQNANNNIGKATKEQEKAAKALEEVRTAAANAGTGTGDGSGAGTGGTGTGGTGGTGTGEHVGPLYTQADVEETRINISNSYKDISDIVSKIKTEILSEKISLKLDDKIFTDLAEVYTKLNALKEDFSGLAANKSETGTTPGTTVPVQPEISADAKQHLTGELVPIITELQKLKIYLGASINPASVQTIVDEVNNLVNLLSTKGPIRLDARLAEKAIEHVKNDIKSVTSVIDNGSGKGIPVDIEISSNSAKAMEDRVTSIVQKVNQAVANSESLNNKDAVNIPAKVASISKIVGKAVSEYNSEEHPSHAVKLQATLTKSSLMSKVREAVKEVNTALIDAKTSGIKVPVKTDSSKTLKDSSLKGTEKLLENIKSKYSEIDIKIKLAKDSDVDKINEVFTKIKEALNQVNKSGGVKIIYNTNGNDIIERSADEEKALKSLNTELTNLTKSYRDFRNTGSLFNDEKTRDSQEAQALKTEVEDLYKKLTTIDFTQLDSHSFTQVLDQFQQKLAELKAKAKDSYSSITSDIEKTATATEKLIQDAATYNDTVMGSKIGKFVNTPSLQQDYDTAQIQQLTDAYGKLQEAITAVENAQANGSDMSTVTKNYADAKKSVEDLYKSLEKIEKKSSSLATSETVSGLEQAKARIAELNGGLGSFDRQSLKAEKGVYTLNYAIQEQNGLLKTVTYKYDTATNELTKYGETEKKVVSIGERFSAMLKERGMSLVAYLGTFASFYRLVGVLRDGINVVYEVDTAFTELRKVAEESENQLRSFANTAAFEVAEKVGSTGKAIIELAADYERLGYSLQEAQRLAEDTAIYMNVGDIESSEEAMNSLVSTMKGFRLEAEDSTKIIDEFNEVGRLLPLNGYNGQSLGAGKTVVRIDTLASCA